MMSISVGVPDTRTRSGVAFAGDIILATVVATTATVIIAANALGPGGRFVVTAIAFGAFGALFLPEVRSHTLTPGRVLLAVSVLVLVAVITPPRGSHDLWSYTMYGRMLAAHGASPFTHVPADFAGDPFLRLVGRGWRHTGSVYGPGFAALAGAGTTLAGASVTASRLFFQGIAAAAFGVALLVVWRRTRDPGAVAFLGLNPALILVINGGHNDLVVGLALLGGTVLLAGRRPYSAGVVLALGALVKLVLVLPIAALLVWAWWRWGRRAANRSGATFGAVVVGAYIVAGGTRALEPLLHAVHQHSRSSIWGFATSLFLQPLGITGPDVMAPLGHLALIAIALGAAFVVLGSVAACRGGPVPAEATAAVVIGATTLLFLLGGSYVLPWYSAWALPLLALAWRSRVATVAAVQAGACTVAYASGMAVGGASGAAFSAYARGVVPILSVGALVYLAWSVRHRRLVDPCWRSVAKEPRSGVRAVDRIASS